MKNCKLLALALLLLFLLSLTAFADGKTVYLDAQSGKDTNDGLSESSAFATLGAAVGAVKDGGTVMLTAPYDIIADYDNGIAGFTEPAHSGEVVITAKYTAAKLNFVLQSGNPSSQIIYYKMNGPTTFRDITLNTSEFAGVAAQFHPVVFDTGITVNNGAKKFFIVGGYEAPTAAENVADKDSFITVNSGDFYKVCGFSRNKGAATVTYTGTSHFTVNGGSIAGIYCAALVNHYGGNTEVTVNGGKVGVIYTGGDSTRQLNGSATVYLYGGNVPKLHVNNTIGNADIYLCGTTLGTNVAITYSRDTQETAAKQARSHKTLHCETALYTAEQVESLKSIFLEFENLAGGSVSGGDLTAELAKLCESGGKLTVSGDTKLSAMTVTAKQPVTVVGDGKASVTLSGSELRLYGDFTFENITLKADALTLTADGILTFGEGVTVLGDLAVQNESGSLSVASGSYKAVTANDLTVTGGSIGEIRAASGSVKEAAILFAGGKADSISIPASAVTGKLILRLRGGEVASVTLGALTAEVICDYDGTKVTSFTVDGVLQNGTLLGNGADGALKAKFPKSASDRMVYLADGGKGDGSSAATPLGDINAAIEALGGAGKIIVSGNYTISAGYYVTAHSGKITFTSDDTVTDYRQSGAAITFDANILLGGETLFEKINFKAAKSAIIYGGGHPLTMGREVETECINGTTTYVSLVGGYNHETDLKSSDLTIESGDWNIVRGGFNAAGMKEEGLFNRVTVTGGRFHNYFACGSRGVSSGTVEVNISGGEFFQGVYALYEEDSYTYDLHYDVTMNISGGTFHGALAPAKSLSTVLHGTYTVNLTGGSFGHLCDLFGADVFGGDMKSALHINGVDIHASETGETQFANPIRYNNADPFLMYYDGFYYYTCTGSTTVKLIKAANLADIKTATPYTILKPTTGKNLWSPEIHHFTAEEVGAGNEGWYMFIAYDDGTTANQRQYVCKCLDGDNLLGRWGDPVTGEVNVPRHVDFADAPAYNNDQLGGGTSVIRIGGRTYVTFISEEGRGTADFHQTVNICTMQNPWTVTGKPTVICEPTEDWEMGGYGQTSTGEWYPKVVEGAAAVYGDNGEVYLMYTGSGYWTKYYQLGYLTFKGGDPMDAANWVKHKDSVFSLSDEVNGCGHASYITDPFGTNWASYHGYLGKDTSDKRWSYFEPYTANAQGVVVGSGSGHPAPLVTVYTVPMNPTPLAKKISGFTETDAKGLARIRTYADSFTDVTPDKWFYEYVKTAYEYALANGTSQTTFSPDSKFTVAQALTAAVNIHKAYFGRTVPAAAAGESWYVPYVRYCVENGIIAEGRFADFDRNITRGEMAEVFAAILPQSEYAETRTGAPADAASLAAVVKLYRSGIVGGDAGTGNYRPDDEILRSEACVIFTRIAAADMRIR